MVQVSATINLPDLTQRVGRHANFAGALIATRLAQDARDLTRLRLPLIFTLRNSWTIRRTQIVMATKNNPVAMVSVPSYLRRSIEGGEHVAPNPRRDGWGLLLTPANRGMRKRYPNISKYISDGGRVVKDFSSGRPRASFRVPIGGRNNFKVVFWMTLRKKWEPRFDFADLVNEAVSHNLSRRWHEVIAELAGKA